MSINFQYDIPSNFSDESRVWIHQASRPFLENEIKEISIMQHDFIVGWKSHGHKVQGYATVFFNQFVILMADETKTKVSGCSTDSVIHLIQEIEKTFDVQLLDRQKLAFIIKKEIQLFPLSKLNDIIQQNIIHSNTLYFNNTVLTKKEMMNEWIVPVKESWLMKRL